MNIRLAFSPLQRLQAIFWIAAMATATLSAQTPTPRIRAEITNSEQVPLKGSLQPRAQAQFESGRLSSDTRLRGITIVFSRTTAQQAALDALIAAQQDPSSPLYHQWLTPEQFGARFGMSQADLDKVEAWLQQQGFSIDSVSRSRNMIRFSGTARQVEQAFQTQMHSYTVDGVRHFAPSTQLSLPAALASTVLAIRNLDDFQPRPHVHPIRARPAFTSGQSGSVFFAPGDIDTVYDIKPLQSSGYNGTGQSITIVGQSDIAVSDIENFQKAALLTVKDPIKVLVPGTGTSTINPQGTNAGDELESDLDIEWAGAIAPGAQIYFVYTGSDKKHGAFDSIAYAIDEKIGNIISASYGDCETDLGSANLQSLDAVIQQAAAQGQTVISSSGDEGSTSCAGITNLTSAQQFALNPSYPASSPWVTAIGGTAISQDNANYEKAGQGYWESTTQGTDIVNSATQYIPETTWNDDLANEQAGGGLSSTGGGPSTYFLTKPSWQTGVPGIPADNKRDVPDVAFHSSPFNPGYLYCSSDPSALGTSLQASCNSGFRDAATQNLTVAGGTSFAAPIFAGMVAILNQKAGYATGQGFINPTLYTLASNPSTYQSAFHDITSGNNNCLGGSSYCGSSPAGGFSAGTGYDMVTGLGSVDLANLAAAWPVNNGPSAGLIGTSTTVTPANATPTRNTPDVFTITVVSTTGAPVTTGTITLIIDGGPLSGGPANTTVNLTSNGTATYSATFTSSGQHQIVAQYPGDATFAPSTGIGSVTIDTITLTVSPANLAIPRGSSGVETVTVTPVGGYTGTVVLTYGTSNNSALANLCVFSGSGANNDGSVTISGTSPVQTQIEFDTNASDCANSAVQRGGHALHRIGAIKTAKNDGTNPVPAGIAFAGMLLIGFLGRHSRKLNALAGVFALVALGLTVSACGGGVSHNVPVNPTRGTYTITLQAQDSVTSSITATTDFTLTIQ